MTTPRRSVAVIAVHGVGSPEPGATARAVADLLQRTAGVGNRFVETSIRLGLPAGEERLQEDSPEGRPFPTVILQGRVTAGDADVFELYWADLSKDKPTTLTIARSLLALAPRLIVLGRSGLAAAASESASVRILDAVYGLAAWLLGWALPVLNGLLVLMVALAGADHLPESIKDGVAIGVAVLLFLAGGFGLAYRRTSSSASALAGFWTTLAAATLVGCVMRSVLARLGTGEGATGVLLASGFILGAFGLTIVLSQMVAPGGRREAVAIAGVFGTTLLVILVRIVQAPSSSDRVPRALEAVGRDITSLLAFVWCALGALALIASFLASALLRRERPRRAWSTARLGLALSFGAGAFLQTLLLLVLRRGEVIRHTGFVPFVSSSMTHLIFDVLSFPGPVLLVLVVVAAWLTVAWSLVPSALEEVAKRPSSPDVGATVRLGLWLTGGRRLLHATGAVGAYAILFGAPVLYIAAARADAVDTLLSIAHARFWQAALPVLVALLVGVIRSPKGMQDLWPALGLVLDVDTYLRDDTRNDGVRRAILERGRRLLDHVFERTEPYASVCLVAHSQGTLIARELVGEWVENGKEGFSLSLLTMGSPLRDLYESLLPYRAPSRTLPHLPGRPRVLAWRNVFFAGDYIGRSLWQESGEACVYSGEEWAEGERSERCLGSGGHMPYWSSPLVGTEIVRILKGCS